jgi:hypothetical protein
MPACFGVFLALIKRPTLVMASNIHCPDLGLVCSGFSAFSLTIRTRFQQCGCDTPVEESPENGARCGRLASVLEKTDSRGKPQLFACMFAA